jgi:ribosomal protein S18 acetylase RimI-like enzyme
MFFKRFDMEYDLNEPLGEATLPYGYEWLSWDRALLTAHGETKWRSFVAEIDGNVFPCLADREGCQRLMRDIARRAGFVPEATWLVAYRSEPDARLEYCGTIQGIHDGQGTGAIQNLGVVPEHRGRRLGAALVWKCLAGFRERDLHRCYLQVTARNVAAVRLYQHLGFRICKTLYKAVDLARAAR